jgi:glycosyltransferase involved in cell wall biosynthesis
MANTLHLIALFLSDISFARLGVKEIKRMSKTFDAAISSYGPFGSHRIGRMVKRLGIAKVWIADFRDVMEPPFPWLKCWARNEALKATRYADLITGVSSGYLESMGIAGITVPNGFDREDLRGGSGDEAIGAEKSLRFVYCGQMYGAKRDLRPFFRALKELCDEGIANKDHMLLEHAGKEQDAEAFRRQAAAFGLENTVKGHGLIPRDKSIRLQRSADAILIAAWNTPDCRDNLPGKLLEMLMMDRPVICCTTGSVPGSESARLINATRTGYCYEEAAGEASFQGLKAYVRRLCEAHSASRPFPFAPSREQVERYAYPKIAQTFSDLIHSIGQRSWEERGK